MKEVLWTGERSMERQIDLLRVVCSEYLAQESREFLRMQS